MTETTVTRREAKKLGLKHYFNNKKCARGHLAPRFVSNAMCKECGKDNDKAERILIRAMKEIIKNKEI